MKVLDQIFAAILKLVPRLILIQPDEAGIRVTLGTREKILASGWYFFWPLIQDVPFATVTTQVIDLRPQSVFTRSGRNLTISGIIKYKVTDIRKAMLDVQDYDRSLQALSLGVLLSILSTTLDVEDLSPNEIGERVLKGIREEAVGWGLKIQKVYISDFGPVRNIRLLTDRLPNSLGPAE